MIGREDEVRGYRNRVKFFQAAMYVLLSFVTARLVYLQLYALQHRGQEAAGIVTYNGSGMHTKLAMGLVADIFDKPALDSLTGEPQKRASPWAPESFPTTARHW